MENKSDITFITPAEQPPRATGLETFDQIKAVVRVALARIAGNIVGSEYLADSEFDEMVEMAVSDATTCLSEILKKVPS